MVRKHDSEGRECSKCTMYKPWSAFNAQKAGLNGRAACCKECQSERAKAARDSIHKVKRVTFKDEGGKVCTSCHTYKPWSSFAKDAYTTDKHTAACKDCRLTKFREWKAANPEKMKAAIDNWVTNNIEYVRECARNYAAAKRERIGREAWAAEVLAWNKANQGKLSAMYKRNYAKNRSAIREKQRLDRINRPCAFRVYDAQARFRRTKGKVGWANKDAIQAIYDFARYLTDLTGFQHHVDHVVPLVHPLVQGLHVEHNLRVIPAQDNLEKGNTFEV